MPTNKRILCPIDLSENSFEAIEMATMLAKDRDSIVDFTYVTPLWFPDDSRLKAPFVNQLVDEHKAKLYRITPTDPAVKFEHHYLEGNAGPTLVRASEHADFVVMGTHGRSGISRLLMGSVANYVLRHAQCPVVLVKGVDVKKEKSSRRTQINATGSYVSELMHDVVPVKSYEKMGSVLESLTRERQTAAPVVDDVGKCIGILTTVDIDNFLSLKRRFDERDESVLQEVLDIDEFGQLRTTGPYFDEVKRHMSSAVVSVNIDDAEQQVLEQFANNPEIHHLVVLDQTDRPVGIIDQVDVSETILGKRTATSIA